MRVAFSPPPRVGTRRESDPRTDSAQVDDSASKPHAVLSATTTESILTDTFMFTLFTSAFPVRAAGSFPVPEAFATDC